MEYVGNLMEVMTEAEIFVEVAFGKVMDGLDYNRFLPACILFSYRTISEEASSVIFGVIDLFNGFYIIVL